MAKMDMQSLMRQAQKMQLEMAKAQEDLKNTEVVGQASGGMVKVTATAGNEIKAIEINPEVVDAEDVEMLQDLIMVAINDAMAQANELSNSKMNAVTGGIKMPF